MNIELAVFHVIQQQTDNYHIGMHKYNTCYLIYKNKLSLSDKFIYLILQVQ